MVANGGELGETRFFWDEFAQVVNLIKINLVFACLLPSETRIMRLVKANLAYSAIPFSLSGNKLESIYLSICKLEVI